MITPKLSIYFYLFNARIRSFDLEGCIANFCAVADEVVCSTIPSDDDTLECLRAEEAARSGHFKVILTNVSLKNNRFDGDLKTAALQACAKSTETDPRIYVIADADERFLVKQRPLWNIAAQYLLASPHIDGWMVPVVDLYGDERYIRDDTIGQKFRMHKATVVRRGVPNMAELADGHFRTDLSDSTEPLNMNGDLATFMPYVRSDLLNPNFTSSLNSQLYVLHYGFLDLNRRADLGREFWKARWEERSGHEENVVTHVEELKQVRTIKHRLDLV